MGFSIGLAATSVVRQSDGVWWASERLHIAPVCLIQSTMTGDIQSDVVAIAREEQFVEMIVVDDT